MNLAKYQNKNIIVHTKDGNDYEGRCVIARDSNGGKEYIPAYVKIGRTEFLENSISRIEEI
ncbi:hypothetical protein [Pectinatus cerevisiiphilus]|uniref:Uncharacterized protein n=1 Tax=Pectinatus cerevisiiphilus TaxID=86956 RepID=A0A4R3K462_9FIRM|nr:hypothetical protein [Pectinatus cerevisiiphilus]TCS77513.1 hypothetical protein EDC37_11558 [Pectinatus cerevisiiphilus]